MNVISEKIRTVQINNRRKGERKLECKGYFSNVPGKGGVDLKFFLLWVQTHCRTKFCKGIQRE